MNLCGFQRFFLRSLGSSIALAFSCTLLYQPKEQCVLDSDCLRLAKASPEFAGTYCQHNVCAPPPQAQGHCQTNQECITSFMGGPAICRDSRCIGLRSGACKAVINEQALKDKEDVLLIGAFSALGNSVNPLTQTGAASFNLAVAEVQAGLLGAKGYTNATVRRPFVFVVCDSTTPTEADASFDHLTKTLGVPVVVTTFQASVLASEWDRLSSDPSFDSMFISAFSSDSTLRFVNQDGRIWSLLGDPAEDLAPAYLRLVERQISKVTTHPAHVLMVVSDVKAMQDIAGYIEPRLMINGMSSAEAMGVGTYRQVGVLSPAIHPQADTSQVASALAEIDPDVVVVLAGPEAVGPAITANESRPRTDRVAGSPDSRFYVLSHHLYEAVTLQAAMPRSITDTSLDKRILGINFAGASDTRLYDGYRSRLLLSYPNASASYDNYYDAAYYAMLSVVGVASGRATQSITGAVVADGFRRLIDLDHGLPNYGIAPEYLADVAGILENSDARLALIGTLGVPDFSPVTGARRSEAAVWCFRQNMQHGGKLEWATDSVRYDRTADGFASDPDSCHIAEP